MIEAARKAMEIVLSILAVFIVFATVNMPFEDMKLKITYPGTSVLSPL